MNSSKLIIVGLWWKMYSEAALLLRQILGLSRFEATDLQNQQIFLELVAKNNFRF